MMTDVLIKAGMPDTSCARACYVGWLYSTVFVVASMFVVAYPTAHVSVHGEDPLLIYQWMSTW